MNRLLVHAGHRSRAPAANTRAMFTVTEFNVTALRAS